MADGDLKERLQKILADAGLGSRREIEGWIRAGRIQVNGRVAELGLRVGQDEKILLDGRRVGIRRSARAKRYVVLYNKPEGEVVTRHDPQGRPSVFARLPKLAQGRWISIGRLDINSAGLLLFTSDGELANRLMHPRQQIEREYAVRVLGEVTDDMLQRLVNGVELEDGPARCEEISRSGGEGANRWYHLVIMEGRKREVRRLWEAVGVRVSRLKRVRFGPIILNSAVKAGQWRELNDAEQVGLLTAADLANDRPWGRLVAEDRRRRALGRSSSKRGRSGGARPSPWGGKGPRR
jgi:23S rRNA pseudouridine2605 synthase